MTLDSRLRGLATGLRRGDADMAMAAGMAADTFALYRALLLSNLEAGLAACYPQCKRLLGSDWPVLVEDFLAHGDIPSPAFHECPEAFLRYIIDRGSKGPPWLAALAHWEWEELALSLAPWSPTPRGRAFASWQDRPLLPPVHCLRSYPFAVHRVEGREGPPEPETVYLFRYRDGAGRICHRQLGPAEARLISAIDEGSETVAAAMALAFPDSPLDGDQHRRIASLFHSWMEEGALLGCRGEECR